MSNEATKFFFSVLDERAHWIVADFRKKPVNFGRKIQVHFRIKKIFFQLCFFWLVFSSPSLTLFKIIKSFFLFRHPHNFSRNLSNFFLFWSPSLTFPKIGSMFFFLECFFYRIFYDLKQRNKKQWPKGNIVLTQTRIELGNLLLIIAWYLID